MAGLENNLSFFWNDDQFDTVIVAVDLGGAQKFTNCTTDKKNGSGSIFFVFYPNTSMINTYCNIMIKIN